MSAQYSIGVTTNRFELFDLGDEDPLELIKKQELEREARKKAKLNEKEVKSKAPPAPPKGKAEKKPSKDFQGAHDGHKTKDEPSAKSAPREDRDRERKANPDFKNQRNAFRGGQDDREKENYRNRDDQDRNVRDRDRDRDGADRYQQDGDGGFKKGGEFGRGRGGGRGGNGFRGRTFQRGGGGRSYPQEARGNKREFDRQSGSNRTGVKPMEKRDGSGGYNWGNPKDDWNQTNEEELNSSNDKENWDTSNNEPVEEWTGPSDNAQWNPETGNNNAPKGDTAAPTATTTPADDSAPPAERPAENPDAPTETDVNKEELTLDEWKAKRGPKVAPNYNLRKAGEGEDLTQWKKMYALRKKKDEEDDEDDEYEYIDYPQRVGRQRHILDIDIRYKDSRGSNNAGRGRGRGRGGFRGNQERNPPPERNREFVPPPSYNKDPSAKEAPKVDDEHDFPSLS